MIWTAKRGPKLVELGYGRVGHQNPQRFFGVIFPIIAFLMGLLALIVKHGIFNVNYSEFLNFFLIAFLFCFALSRIFSAFRVILTPDSLYYMNLYPTFLLSYRAPLDRMVKVEKGPVPWGARWPGLVFHYTHLNGSADKIHIALHNFPTREVQRILDEIAQRRPDLKMPEVGKKQQRAIDLMIPAKRPRRKK